jgi:hypothetical protein
MPLFTDGVISTIADLKAYESSVLDLAAREGIDLAAKLEIAQREIELELAAFLLRRGVQLGPERELTNVIVTKPLAHLHSVHTLALVYRDAFNSQLNDRYFGKWKEYTRLSDRAQRVLLEIGLGMSNAPVPKAATPLASVAAGGALAPATYYLRIAWLGLRGQAGAPSDTVAVGASYGERPSLRIPAQSGAISGAIVYAGESESRMRRQNDEPAPPGSVWAMSESGLRQDLEDPPLQTADFFVANRNQLLRV